MNMVRGYLVEEIREKLISILKDSDSGLSGVEISKKINVSRITMIKYLKVFAAEGLLRQKNIGNVTLWFLEPGQESFIFPDDYYKITSKYLELLVKGNEDQVYSLIRNCLNSGASINKLILEVIYPTIEYVNNLFDSGKIGTAEQNLLRTTISKSLNIFNQIPLVPDPKKKCCCNCC
ncbi:B12-binding domain-containing protein [Nitrosopumilus sp.]|nr:B12-binding domain-containing protein [Nitrosopumilus sp.]